jgi:hypothetical protein
MGNKSTTGQLAYMHRQRAGCAVDGQQRSKQQRVAVLHHLQEHASPGRQGEFPTSLGDANISLGDANISLGDAYITVGHTTARGVRTCAGGDGRGQGSGKHEDRCERPAADGGRDRQLRGAPQAEGALK